MEIRIDAHRHCTQWKRPVIVSKKLFFTISYTHDVRPWALIGPFSNLFLR
jgi:hypothetical protein